MMESMLYENGITFKSLEREIFRIVCKVGVELTKEFLEEYDEYLHDSRDSREYRDKGKRGTTIKTVYGNVPYSRHVYQTRDEYGANRSVYLLDENLKLDRIGLVSENVVELLVSSVTEMSYRNCAATTTDMTGLPISHMGVWNIMQKLGEKLEDDERQLAEANSRGHLHGKREVPVLFEEADGIWLSIQGNDRKSRKNTKAEMKAAIAYDGWKDEGSGRYSLSGKVVTAGFETARSFQKTREAVIASEYNTDEIRMRFINGDGASWIRKTVDKDTVFQLDPFHRNKSVREHLSHPKAVTDVSGLLESGRIGEAFEYLETYRDSLDDDKEIGDADELISYLQSNRDGLIPYNKRGLDIPQSPEGLVYRDMGTMESHMWSVIAKRMKHNHTSWSIEGGNHLAKILAKKCSGKLYEVTEKLGVPVFEEEKFDEIKGEVLTAARIREKVGEGYAYPVTGSLLWIEGKRQGDATIPRTIAGY